MAEPLYEHFPHVAARVVDAPSLLLLLDFDGTLTPLVDHPADAKLPSETRQTLETLATRRNCHVAVLSGRSLEDIKDKVPVPGVIHAGNHGLEIQGPDFHYTHPTALACQERIQVVATRLQSYLSDIPGAWVENKKLTLSIHTRHVRSGDMARVQDALLRAMRYQIPYLLIATGVHVLEVRPRVGWDNGKAAVLLRQRLGPTTVLTVSVGDEQTDEELFRATATGITVKVGMVGNSMAGYTLASPEEVHEFLQWLATLPVDKSPLMHHPSLLSQEA